MTQRNNTTKDLTAAGLILLVAGQLMPQMDFSIVNVALDAISDSLHANKTQLGLIVSLYGLAFAVSLAMSGRLGDRYGRKKLFLSGIASFAVASFFCGLAPNIYTLIGARILQGMSAALLMPQILATIHVTLHGERHSKAIGIYGSVGGLSFIIGQILGGWLVSADLFGLGWRSVFYINLPICAAILYWGQRYIPETKEASSPSIDWPGTALLGVIVTLVLTSISAGPEYNWNTWIWAMLAVCVPLMMILWRIEGCKESRGETPLMPPTLLTRPKVILGCASLMLQTASYGGFMFVVALTLQSGFHLSSFDSGNAFIGLGAAYFMGSLYVGKLVKRMTRFGYTGIIACGCVLNLIGYVALYYLMSANSDNLTPLTMLAPMLLIGVGNAFGVNSSLRIGLSDMPAQFAGVGSAFMTTIQQTSIALGTALCAAFYIQNLASDNDYHLVALKAGLLVIAGFITLLLLIHAYAATRINKATQA
ncbi:MFS transporter [Vibrio palustris]|uniref:Multidrug resistance protein stp n=1 Tax=Vibrio palustris TaxID=1918946 RepID=A0A1R4B530_9VIBR|nr:MFS transporter [Vibrio palustris]SJL84006.1 Multidrug resistance protein stp [Vibrio palustris]